MSRSSALILLKYAIGALILVAIVAKNWNVTQDGEQVGFSAILTRPLHPGFFALGLGVCAIGVAITFVRWYYLVTAQNLPITPHDVVRLGLIGFFFNTFLPGSVGGDLVKAAYLVREQSRRTLAVATVIMDRVIGLAGAFWLATILGGSLYLAGAYDSLLADPGARIAVESILIFTSAVMAATVVAWIVIGLIPPRWLDRMEERLERIAKVGHGLAELVRAVRVYHQKGRTVALALAMSVVGHFCFVVTFYCAARIFQPADETPPLAAHLLIVPVGLTIRALIPLPAGLGGGELSFGTLYEWFGAPFIGGVLGSIGQLLFLLILGSLGLIVYRTFETRGGDKPEGLSVNDPPAGPPNPSTPSAESPAAPSPTNQ